MESNRLVLTRDYVKEYTDITKVKEKLYTEIYPIYIEELLNDIRTSIDLFSISITNNVINMKIKKTSIKKYDSYNHDASFYYTIIDNIMYNFITRHIDCALLNSVNINLFYSITTLCDNVVCIHL